MRVLRVYHGGRDRSHRARERALVEAGVDVTLVVPTYWRGESLDLGVSADNFDIVELDVRRDGDVNRHAYSRVEQLSRVIRRVRPDVLDIHEEPVSIAARQWLAAARAELPVMIYTAQNVDKRYPFPFAQYERAAYRRAAGLYPCSAQAASVARGKGFTGIIEVLPLGFEDSVMTQGQQSLDDGDILLGFFGRLVPEKGVTDAVQVLARLNSVRSTRLVIVGSGPEGPRALDLAARLGVSDRTELKSWLTGEELAATYRRCHIVLVPSMPTATWVEQFGRVIVEAQASGAVVGGYASGSIREAAGDGAILTDEGSVTELAESIARLVADPSDFACRRERGLTLSATRTWTRVAESQAQLYDRVVAGDVRRLRLPRSPRERRVLARAEFGQTAATIAGVRPFALPYLRRGGTAPSALASVLDTAAELVAQVSVRRPTNATE